MQRLFRFSFDHAWTVLISLGIVTILLAVPALRCPIDVSHDALIPNKSAGCAEYESVKSTFGSDIVASVYVRDAQLFSTKKLQRLRSLYDQLAALNGVEKAESLFTVNNIKGDATSIDTSPLLDWISPDPVELSIKQKNAIANPLLNRNYISTDGKSTVITLFLVSKEGDLNFERQIKKQIDRILNPYSNDFDQIFQIGAPYVHSAMVDYIWEDQKTLLPVSALVLIIFIAFSLNSVHGAIVPLVNAFVSAVWTFGIMQLLGIPINLLTYTIPALLIVIGSAEDIHLISEYLEKLREGLSSRDAICTVGKKLGVSLIFNAFTTIVGFGSTALTDIPILQQFGIASAIGMATNFLITILFLPAYLHVIGKRLQAHPKHLETKESHTLMMRVTQSIAKIITTTVLHHRFKMILLFVALSIPALIMAFKIHINNDLMSFFKPNSPITHRMNVLHEDLVGSRVIYATLRKEEGDFKLAKNLRMAEAVEQYLQTFKDFDSILSLPDYLALVHREMHEGKTSYHQVPDDNNLIAQYLLFFQRHDLERYISSDFSQLNIVIRHNINSSTRLNEILEAVQKKLASEQFGNFKFSISGKDVLIAGAVENIATGQMTSLSTDIVVIFVLIGALFLSAKAGALSALPNLFPLVIVFGAMGLFHIPLNIGTAMVGAITIGIAVDDTVHFMVRYNQELKQWGDERKALVNTIHSEVLPVMITGLALAAGFFALMFSSFVPVAQFGMLSGWMMLVAVITDLILTPVLLSSVRLITLWDAIGLKLREQAIKRSILFQGMRQWQIKRLILMCNLVEFKKDRKIMQEGDPGDFMYLVLDGELKISRVIHGENLEIGKLVVGDVFGELALIFNDKRTATISAETDVKLLALDWKSLERLQRYMPFISSTFFLNIAKILGLRWMDTVKKVENRP